MYFVEDREGRVLRECVDVLDALALLRSLAHGWRVVRAEDGAVLSSFSAAEAHAEIARPAVPRGRRRAA